MPTAVAIATATARSARLVLVMMLRGTITYGDLVTLVFGPGFKSSPKHHDLVTNSLDRIAEIALPDKVALPVLVVNADKGVPGGSMKPGKLGGFYAWADEHGFDVSDPYRFVVEQQNRCDEYVRILRDKLSTV
jgi:hypothetical protein